MNIHSVFVVGNRILKPSVILPLYWLSQTMMTRAEWPDSFSDAAPCASAAINRVGHLPAVQDILSRQGFNLKQQKSTTRDWRLRHCPMLGGALDYRPSPTIHTVPTIS
jgi:hypothetical protein